MTNQLPPGRALVVGINQYPNAPLDCCVNDAQEIAGVLSFEEYNFQVTTLQDAKASRSALVRELTDLFTNSDETRLLFYFAGHGTSLQHGVYLETPDGTDFEPGVDLPFVNRLLQIATDSGRSAFIILDCCHAGAMGLRGQPSRTNISSDGITQAFSLAPEGSAILAACRPEEPASENTSLSHGIFTFHLLAGLLGDAANETGQMTANSLYDYVSRSVTKELTQTTVFRGDITGSLVLGSNFEPLQRKHLDAPTRKDVERRAEYLLTDYQRKIGQAFSDRTVWAKSGYKLACQLLPTTVEWFKLKLVEFPELRNKGSFRKTLKELRAWQTRLVDLDGVENTPWGRAMDRIGSGTFGTVWKIKPTTPDEKTTAFKIFHSNDIYTRDKLVRFKRGYEAMQKLDHPHIVKVILYTTCPIGFFMDFIDGPNLRDFTGCQEPHEYLLLLSVIAETLAHAHNRGVIHRDVKPENILMRLYDHTWSPYLTDFDLAWFSSASVVTKEAMGSAFYAAPEQIYKPGSSASRHPKVDIYAFGQLCFYTFTGSDPIPNAADNVYALQKRLEKWASAAVATEIVKLYQATTQHKPESRPDNFRSICDWLSRINILSTGDPDDPIKSDRFIQEATYSLIGLRDDGNRAESFMSMSGSTQVSITVTSEANRSLSLSMNLRRVRVFSLPGSDHYSARKLMNARLEDVLRRYPYTKMRVGHQGAYEVLIQAYDIALTLAGVEDFRKMASRAIEAVESDAF